MNTTNNYPIPQWVSQNVDTNTQINNDAFMTYLLFTELQRQTDDQELLSLFWVNLMVAHKNLEESMWSEDNVYCYPTSNSTLVMTTPALEVHIGTSFIINIDCNGVTEDVVANGLLPVLKTIRKHNIIDTSVDDTRNYVSIGGNNPTSLIDAFTSVMRTTMPPSEEVVKPSVAKPLKKYEVIKNSADYPLRGTYGWRKSYDELHEVLDDYILEATDLAVLPVINADILGCLKLQGGVYVDPLTEVQITYEGQDIIVCVDTWKVILSAKCRNGRYTVYSGTASADANYPDDLRELAKALHALNNLYKNHQ